MIWAVRGHKATKETYAYVIAESAEAAARAVARHRKEREQPMHAAWDVLGIRRDAGVVGDTYHGIVGRAFDETKLVTIRL